jgi:hypothetical protein
MELAKTDLPQAPRRLLHGTFIDPSLEAEFQREHFEVDVHRFVRVSIPLALVFFLVYGFHDVLLIPEARTEAWIVRFALFNPHHTSVASLPLPVQ